MCRTVRAVFTNERQKHKRSSNKRSVRMASYLRPTSLELEITKADLSEGPIKQLDVLQEIIYIMERDPDLHHINIEGFERNSAQKYTITVDSRDHRALLKHHFENNPLEFLHYIPVGSKLGIYMPNMAMPDLNKF